VIVLNRETIDLADLFGGEYGSHAKDDSRKRKSAARAARLPAAAPTVRFPGYLNYIFNTSSPPEKFQKKFLEQAASLFQNQKEHFAFVFYIVIAARTLLRLMF